MHQPGVQATRETPAVGLHAHRRTHGPGICLGQTRVVDECPSFRRSGRGNDMLADALRGDAKRSCTSASGLTATHRLIAAEPFPTGDSRRPDMRLILPCGRFDNVSKAVGPPEMSTTAATPLAIGALRPNRKPHRLHRPAAAILGNVVFADNRYGPEPVVQWLTLMKVASKKASSQVRNGPRTAATLSCLWSQPLSDDCGYPKAQSRRSKASTCPEY